MEILIPIILSLFFICVFVLTFRKPDNKLFNVSLILSTIGILTFFLLQALASNQDFLSGKRSNLQRTSIYIFISFFIVSSILTGLQVFKKQNAATRHYIVFVVQITLLSFMAYVLIISGAFII